VRAMHIGEGRLGTEANPLRIGREIDHGRAG
jgi:hypothetical protein